MAGSEYIRRKPHIEDKEVNGGLLGYVKEMDLTLRAKESHRRLL